MRGCMDNMWSHGYGSNKDNGVRPAVNILSDTLVEPDGSGKYRIVYE